MLTLPPLRFVFGADPGSAFALDAPAAHAQLAEVVGSIAASGFERIVLFNASPWNEEVCAAASRDLRLRLGVQIFRINLSALGLDFHPVRSRDRLAVQTLVTALTGRMPEAAASGPGQAPSAGWGDERVTPLAGPPAPLARAQTEGMETLRIAAERLASLLSEAAARPRPEREL
jgi:creatinine amidohydrolase